MKKAILILGAAATKAYEALLTGELTNVILEEKSFLTKDGKTLAYFAFEKLTDYIYKIKINKADKIQSTKVLAKTQTALKYSNHATQFITEHGGKQWNYVLIPFDHESKTGSFREAISPSIRK